MTLTRTLPVGFALLILLGGCGPRAFTPQFPESQDPEITRSLSALSEPAPAEERPVVVGARADGLFAFDPVAGEMLWKREVELLAAPIAAGNVVVTQEPQGITGRRLEDGEVSFRLEQGLRLVGAHGDGERVVITAAEGPEETPRGVVVLVRGDDVRWTERLDMPVGRAALVGERVVVPWATQRVSILQASSGLELARFRMTDSVVGHALLAGGRVYVGQHGLLQVRNGIEEGTRQSAPYYEPQGRSLPGQPPLMRDGYEVHPGPEAAPHRLRLGWRVVSEGDEVGLEDDTLYFVFYRMIFAFAADEDSLRWVHVHPADVVGLEVTADGPVLLDAGGDLVALASDTGQPRWHRSTGERATAAHVRLADADPADLQGTPVETAEAPPPLADQLVAAATVEDSRLAGGRALAASYLGRHEGADVTGQLVGICADRALPESTRLAACEQVATRSEGIEHVRSALSAKHSFLDGTEAPPVGPLARAAAHMNARGQVPVLIGHLEDPGTPNEELPDLLRALGDLGVGAAAGPIEGFFRLHHAERDDPALTGAVLAAARALVQLKGEQATPVLREAIEDPLASQQVREGVHVVLTEPTPAEQDAATAAAEDAEEAEAAEQETVDERPQRIDARMTARAFQPILPQLRECLEEGRPSLRIAMTVSGEGAVERVVVTPPSAQECIEPLVRARSYPATREGRQRVSYTVRRAAQEP